MNIKPIPGTAREALDQLADATTRAAPMARMLPVAARELIVAHQAALLALSEEVAVLRLAVDRARHDAEVGLADLRETVYWISCEQKYLNDVHRAATGNEMPPCDSDVAAADADEREDREAAAEDAGVRHGRG